MPKYIFTFDETDNSFPERYRVITEGEDGEFLSTAEELTGTVLNTEAIDLLEKLMARCEEAPDIRAEMVDAPYWRFIEMRFKPKEAEIAAASRNRNGVTP